MKVKSHFLHFSLSALLIGSCFVAQAEEATAAAAQPLSFNIGIVSLYKSNGIDQDTRTPEDTRPALQGGADYTFSNGIYAGTWASTGSFGPNSKADAELDLYGGYRGSITENLSYDVGLLRFVYPGDGEGWNATQWNVRLTYGMFTLDVNEGVTNEDRLVIPGGVALLAKVPLNEKLTLNARYGTRAKNGPNDYALGLTYDLGGGLQLTGSVSGAEESKIGPAGKTRFVVGVIKNF